MKSSDFFCENKVNSSVTFTQRLDHHTQLFMFNIRRQLVKAPNTTIINPSTVDLYSQTQSII